MTRLFEWSNVLGIAISADAVRGLALRDGQVSWSREVPVGPDAPLEQALRTLLNLAPRARWGRTTAAFVVGPAYAQLRRLRNLPVVRDRRMLADIVQQSAGRYFLQDGVPVITTKIGALHESGRWAGAIDEPVIAAVLEACRAERIGVASIAPTAATLGSALPEGELLWSDGNVKLHLRYHDAELRECRRVPASMPMDEGNIKDEKLDAGLAALGGDARRYADAYAAARGAHNVALALPRERIGGETPSTLRLTLATMACTAALLLALLSPAISAVRAERRAAAQLSALGAGARRSLVSERAVMDTARTLGELAAFQRGAPSVTLLLASLTEALEAPTMLVNLRLDDSGGTLTALTPSAASLLEMLGNVDGISAPAISGSVTPEVQGGPAAPPMLRPPTLSAASGAAEPDRPRLERVTVRFHWRGEKPQRRTPTVGGAR